MASPQPTNRFLSVVRSIPFQIAIASGVSFTAPGMWDALNNLGAGGAAEPYAVSAANALLYGLFAVVCIAAGAINNRIGLRYGLALGAIGYPIYGAGLYTNNYSPTTWFLLFGSALCGISAGFFWAAEAAIIIGYPSPKDRAFYLASLAIWQTAKAAGPIVGGAIELGLNAQNSGKGTVSASTYIVFIVLMCLGLPIGLCLSPAEKVQRKDRTLVVVHTQATTWLTDYFTVRSRAFSSFFTNFAGITSSFLIATLLDKQSIHIKTRARIAFASLIFVLVGTWIWATILQYQFYYEYTNPVFDWFKGGFGKTYALVFFWSFGGQAFQQFLYWLVGQYTTDLSSLSHHCGILRGFEALGQTVAWAMQSEGNANHFVSIGLNFGITLLCVIPTWIIISELEHTHEVEVRAEDTAKTVDDGEAEPQTA
ncbi:similar to DUF895 domain membrane protein [Aspergillus luchuensis]|uniref:Similar to DUF895 domain membrane protein n=1 Tax=Aspergillus kawachii TaxID=1069201 RepID=A0A146EYK4_ASPKA|nr:similar to DUF895 domain membrane protein [Aspergillus luchuensis]